MAKAKRPEAKKGSKPSAKQLAARKRFVAMAKTRAKKSTIKRPKAIKVEKSATGVTMLPYARKASLKPSASGRKQPSGPDSRQDDVSKVAVRVPSLVLEPMKDTAYELDLGGYSRLAW